ncbi:cysteine desulfurase NifS [Candidatus Arthromitus sp. SFB-mouse-Japan]|uniref:cysteine desulfurase family protein n=1 Tax=Candidatus Arthromitus sp. SFB-mouse TaxID=49118 RepID=UPI00021B7D44|nr:cysteine desulfurase family protein [Candidatus Arthromitus sp. SFB-mouse]EIA24195.1 Cysteine desulfurase NifS [Candidatus Arthromitus sp. SFB-2]EIA27742.1 Cysteine desulfurase NifS [Candidatus Arthromitus sp. SFB-co]EIA28159.1 Cysteine desulfurase NifS [Candidatus Arthromitus sp. SFB-5]EIA30183.1 Cysteine desulfurase NifS [Candidatus Arthromitus sp. SFB-4]EIA30883.1 Cysteine desulfurase NifS [Candidatus Arthromitus sp. SFB-mouse-SU]
MNERIYMDYASTTFLRDEVIDTMKPYLTECFGNPSGIHEFSRVAKNAIEHSRENIARVLRCQRKEVFFTSGGTESNNWAIKGVAFANRKKGNHIITTKIEHHSVLYTCKYLEQNGFKVTYLDVDSDGIVNVNDINNAITDKTILVSIAFVNNEIGTIQDIEAISELCHNKNIIFHTDAIQAIGKIDISLDKYEFVNLLSISGHKIYGPKGIGILYIKDGTSIDNYIHGGSQEKGRRSGTENVYGIVGLSKAIELVCEDIDEENRKLKELRDYMIDRILKEIPNSRINGSLKYRTSNNINVCFEGIKDEGILLALDLKGICASSGSSCNSGSVNSSHVLQAIGLSSLEAQGSVRFTLGKNSKKEDADYVIEELKDIVKRYRG